MRGAAFETRDFPLPGERAGQAVSFPSRSPPGILDPSAGFQRMGRL
jgi:hypothetical protein